jgi:hypothetical protein
VSKTSSGQTDRTEWGAEFVRAGGEEEWVTCDRLKAEAG